MLGRWAVSVSSLSTFSSPEDCYASMESLFMAKSLASWILTDSAILILSLTMDWAGIFVSSCLYCYSAFLLAAGDRPSRRILARFWVATELNVLFIGLVC